MRSEDQGWYASTLDVPILFALVSHEPLRMNPRWTPHWSVAGGEFTTSAFRHWQSAGCLSRPWVAPTLVEHLGWWPGTKSSTRFAKQNGWHLALHVSNTARPFAEMVLVPKGIQMDSRWIDAFHMHTYYLSTKLQATNKIVKHQSHFWFTSSFLSGFLHPCHSTFKTIPLQVKTPCSTTRSFRMLSLAMASWLDGIMPMPSWTCVAYWLHARALNWSSGPIWRRWTQPCPENFQRASGRQHIDLVRAMLKVGYGGVDMILQSNFGFEVFLFSGYDSGWVT